MARRDQFSDVFWPNVAPKPFSATTCVRKRLVAMSACVGKCFVSMGACVQAPMCRGRLHAAACIQPPMPGIQSSLTKSAAIRNHPLNEHADADLLSQRLRRSAQDLPEQTILIKVSNSVTQGPEARMFFVCGVHLCANFSKTLHLGCFSLHVQESKVHLQQTKGKG